MAFARRVDRRRSGPAAQHERAAERFDLGLDYDIVWEVVTGDLPVLAGELDRIG